MSPAEAQPAAVPELPPRRERWVLFALATVAFALNLNTNVLGALLPFLPRDLGLPVGGGGYLVAAAAFGSTLGALAAAPVAARFGRRTALGGGLLCFVVLSLAHGLVDGYTGLLWLRGAAGLAVGLAYAAAAAILAEAVPYARRGAAMGWFNAGMFLAVPVGLPLSIWLASALHWSAIFQGQAFVGAVGAVLAYAVLPRREASPPPRALLRLLRQPAVIGGLTATMLHVGSFFTAVQLASGWLDERGLLPKHQQIWLWVGLGAASVLGSGLLGKVSDRIGKRRFVLATSAVLVACFAVLALEPGPLLLGCLAVVLASVAAARTGPQQALISGLVAPGELAALMGLRGALMQLGVALFAWLAAQLILPAFEFRGLLVFAAACQLASLLLIYRFVRIA